VLSTLISAVNCKNTRKHGSQFQDTRARKLQGELYRRNRSVPANREAQFWEIQHLIKEQPTQTTESKTRNFHLPNEGELRKLHRKHEVQKTSCSVEIHDEGLLDNVAKHSLNFPPRFYEDLHSSTIAADEKNRTDSTLKSVALTGSVSEKYFPVLPVIYKYAYLIPQSTTREIKLKLVRSLLHLQSNPPPGSVGFEDGYQTTTRTRAAFQLESFPEKELLLCQLASHLLRIQKRNPTFAKDFSPNVLISFLVFHGGTLQTHINDDCGSPFVAVWTFGNSLLYKMRPPNAKRKLIRRQSLGENTISESEITFDFNSGDFLIFDGRKVPHGYLQCNDATFDSTCSMSDYIKGKFRLGITLAQYDDPSKLPVYFYNGMKHHLPKY